MFAKLIRDLRGDSGRLRDEIIEPLGFVNGTCVRRILRRDGGSHEDNSKNLRHRDGMITARLNELYDCLTKQIREITMHTIRSRGFSIAALGLLFACAPATASKSNPGTPAASASLPAQYTMEDFYGNASFDGASWSPDAKNVLVSSNISGIWNAYTISASGGAPTPLTQSKTNSIRAISYFPADERMLYSSDEGGNELTHIFVRNPDGTTRHLTPGPKLKANFQGWAGDDKSFFVST